MNRPSLLAFVSRRVKRQLQRTAGCLDVVCFRLGQAM
jgi:hypothetical protein